MQSPEWTAQKKKVLQKLLDTGVIVDEEGKRAALRDKLRVQYRIPSCGKQGVLQSVFRRDFFDDGARRHLRSSLLDRRALQAQVPFEQTLRATTSCSAFPSAHQFHRVVFNHKPRVEQAYPLAQPSNLTSILPAIERFSYPGNETLLAISKRPKRMFDENTIVARLAERLVLEDEEGFIRVYDEVLPVDLTQSELLNIKRKARILANHSKFQARIRRKLSTGGGLGHINWDNEDENIDNI
mmetsp:Transcript_19144/g.31335  ORF Transcript_19144/g.31335 Transcript_19144/m.31335 type:complete len:240 (-) Transcript_19144:364-1083(-)|eukprot:CAMPEP_0184644984 /NCGR_PEP_ID=MMETSP0308-20130426/1568_1 /TAXON_ID=38269 /ORGANISM="Gloeochaete witrockiana, Strain SAG 46.84" /LENGTH=239 /DNA_ID=CAMNT_0027073757 /DNA_START=122 /DNA_END=841 /DNA_ORIENTATION=+